MLPLQHVVFGSRALPTAARSLPVTAGVGGKFQPFPYPLVGFIGGKSGGPHPSVHGCTPVDVDYNVWH